MNGTADPMVADAMLMCEKQRNGEAEDWFKLWYNAGSQQFVDSSQSKPIDFDGGSEF
jgi:hypothetical protein